MADAVISVLVDQIVSRSLKKIEEEVRLIKNAKKEIERLKKSLRLIQALLEDAEKKQIESASVRQWLSDLEDMSYDMDNVLDEWNAAILTAEIQKEAAGGSAHGDHSGGDVQKKVGFSMPSSCFCFKQRVKEVTSLRNFAKKIKELNEELDRTKKDGNELGIVSRVIEPFEHQKQATSFIKKPRITTSFVDETKIHGRDQDKALLVSKLVCESSSDDHKGKGIEIIPIVGMGGIGKTTLAQIAYNDDTVKVHFGKRIWVCVSDPFDLIKVAKAIIEGLGGNPQSYMELEASVQFISEAIRGMKLLLVLDDVWSKDKETWEKLYQPLQYGAPGSRILVTTRNKEVALMMGISNHMINTLETLSDEQCWSIIKQLAVVEEGYELTQLEAVGKKIARKCKGLPLTAKFLGSLMCLKKSKRQWEEILRSELWESEIVDKKIFAPFLLSYYDLSPIEKCCFSYCSVFPKDHVIEIEMLIEMWMSQGYFDDSSKGQDCFEGLAMRSFFQDFSIEEDGSNWSCKIHDMVHDFAQFLTKNKCVLIEGDTIREKLESLDGKARVMTLVVESPHQFPQTKPDRMNIGNKFRSLCVVPGRTAVEACGFDLINLTCFRTVRTLHLKSTHNRSAMTLTKFPHNFPMMLHLRFLDLSYMYLLSELPESLCDLCNLQTLRLNSCLALQKLPTGIGKLVNLKHLYILECYSLEGFPKGFEKLTRLQKLDALIVPENRDANFDIADLKKLAALRLQGGLTMKRCTNFANPGEAEKFMALNNMEDLDTLNLIFQVPDPRIHSGGGSEAEDRILEALRPHQNLKTMLIWFYKGLTVSPSWIASLKNLRFLRIMECPWCKALPPLGKLSSLEKLEIRNMQSVEKVGLEFLGILDRRSGQGATTSFVSFPRLKKLVFDQLINWKEWEGIDIEAADSGSLKVMPCLHSLSIEVCGSLKVLPDFLLMTPLKNLCIDGTSRHASKMVKKGKGKKNMDED